VPLALAGRRRALDPARLSGWLLADGRSLAVVAVEEGAARLHLVRDLDTEEALRSLGPVARRVRDGLGDGPSRIDRDYYRYALRLPAGDVARFLWPTAKPAPAATRPVDLFEVSRDFDAAEGGLHWLLTRVRHRGESAAGQRFADAAAVAGLQAMAGNRRRAVLVVLGGAEDSSRLEPAAVRRYLAAVRVPLVVWRLGHSPPAGAAWGESEVISSLGRLNAAFSRLERALAAQRIVWVEGRHPPHRVTLSPAARAAGLRLAGEG
jgi:hypothetical protein